MVSRDEIIETFKQIFDPELFIDIWTLGLIYGIEQEDETGIVNITMTFTSVACPAGPQLVDEIKVKLSRLEGVKGVNVEIVFTPPWEPSEDLKATLGLI